MANVQRRTHGALAAVLSIAFALLVLVPISAAATNVQFVGNVGYSLVNDTAVLTADKVQNFASSSSGNLRMELWAFSKPYTGVQQVGYRLSQFSLGSLSAGNAFSNVNSGAIPYASPPDGTWVATIFLSEYSPTTSGDGYTYRDYVNLATPLVVGPPPLPPSTVTPHIGMWWNPGESGTGYSLDYKHGVLVVTIYSYKTNGESQWYLAAGPVSGTSFTASLDKYTGGQCISCTYTGRPAFAGNDGTITINFSSPTSATVLLPGGRVTYIQPQDF